MCVLGGHHVTFCRHSLPGAGIARARLSAARHGLLSLRGQRGGLAVATLAERPLRLGQVGGEELFQEVDVLKNLMLTSNSYNHPLPKTCASDKGVERKKEVEESRRRVLNAGRTVNIVLPLCPLF